MLKIKTILFGLTAIGLLLLMDTLCVGGYVYAREDDFMRSFYSNEYDVKTPAIGSAEKFILLPKAYRDWFPYLSAALGKFDEVITTENDSIDFGTIFPEALVVKGCDDYFSIQKDPVTFQYHLEKLSVPPVYPWRYLLLYFSIFSSLIIIPNLLGYAALRKIKTLPGRLKEVIALIGFMFSLGLVGYLYLYHWLVLFKTWLVG